MSRLGVWLLAVVTAQVYANQAPCKITLGGPDGEQVPLPNAQPCGWRDTCSRHVTMTSATSGPAYTLFFCSSAGEYKSCAENLAESKSRCNPMVPTQSCNLADQMSQFIDPLDPDLPDILSPDAPDMPDFLLPSYLNSGQQAPGTGGPPATTDSSATPGAPANPQAPVFGQPGSNGGFPYGGGFYDFESPDSPDTPDRPDAGEYGSHVGAPASGLAAMPYHYGDTTDPPDAPDNVLPAQAWRRRPKRKRKSKRRKGRRGRSLVASTVGPAAVAQTSTVAPAPDTTSVGSPVNSLPGSRPGGIPKGWSRGDWLDHQADIFEAQQDRYYAGLINNGQMSGYGSMFPQDLPDGVLHPSTMYDMDSPDVPDPPQRRKKFRKRKRKTRKGKKNKKKRTGTFFGKRQLFGTTGESTPAWWTTTQIPSASSSAGPTTSAPYTATSVYGSATTTSSMGSSGGSATNGGAGNMGSNSGSNSMPFMDADAWSDHMDTLSDMGMGVSGNFGSGQYVDYDAMSDRLDTMADMAGYRPNTGGSGGNQFVDYDAMSDRLEAMGHMSGYRPNGASGFAGYDMDLPDNYFQQQQHQQQHQQNQQHQQQHHTGSAANNAWNSPYYDADLPDNYHRYSTATGNNHNYLMYADFDSPDTPDRPDSSGRRRRPWFPKRRRKNRRRPGYRRRWRRRIGGMAGGVHRDPDAISDHMDTLQDLRHYQNQQHHASANGGFMDPDAHADYLDTLQDLGHYGQGSGMGHGSGNHMPGNAGGIPYDADLPDYMGPGMSVGQGSQGTVQDIGLSGAGSWPGYGGGYMFDLDLPDAISDPRRRKGRKRGGRKSKRKRGGRRRGGKRKKVKAIAPPPASTSAPVPVVLPTQPPSGSTLPPFVKRAVGDTCDTYYLVFNDGSISDRYYFCPGSDIIPTNFNICVL